MRNLNFKLCDDAQRSCLFLSFGCPSSERVISYRSTAMVMGNVALCSDSQDITSPGCVARMHARERGKSMDRLNERHEDIGQERRMKMEKSARKE